MEYLEGARVLVLDYLGKLPILVRLEGDYCLVGLDFTQYITSVDLEFVRKWGIRKGFLYLGHLIDKNAMIPNLISFGLGPLDDCALGHRRRQRRHLHLQH